jgi:hypothetical protein
MGEGIGAALQTLFKQILPLNNVLHVTFPLPFFRPISGDSLHSFYIEEERLYDSHTPILAKYTKAIQRGIRRIIGTKLLRAFMEHSHSVGDTLQ